MRLMVLALCLAAVSAAVAAGPTTTVGDAASVSPERFAAHVSWLAEDSRKGRQTGSPELSEVAAYVAEAFEQAGLEPLGEDGGWYQSFEALGDRVLAEGNALTAAGEVLALGQDWMPFQTAASGEVSGPLVFAGYGITDTGGDYDDYAELDVDGKIVVVLRKAPRASPQWESMPGPFAEKRWLGLRTFGHKINNAYKHGAAGIIIVNDPANYDPGTVDDNLLRYGPMSLGGPAASLPAVQLTAAAGLALMAAADQDLTQLQDLIDHDAVPQSRVLDGVEATIKVRSERETVDTVNVVGVLRGTDPDLAHEHVVIGAHMDHVGLGLRTGSRGGPEAQGEIHNGADDNASGTAGLMEIARVLGGRRDELRRSVVFIAFSGEEWGLLGSRHYVDHPLMPRDDLVAMINMDMIGRSKNGYVLVEGMGTSPGFADLIEGVHADVGGELALNTAERPSSNSDHHPFFVAKVPVISFFTGLHDDYHMPSDDAELINVEGGAAIARMAGETVLRLAAADERPAFTQPEEAEPSSHAASSASSGSGYQVVFGTSPDMGYQEEDGVRISGVREGTPAAEAGVQPGDVIVAMDGQSIRNLQDYAVLLFGHRPGDEIVVTLRRGDEQLDVKAVLEGKAGDS